MVFAAPPETTKFIISIQQLQLPFFEFTSERRVRIRHRSPQNPPKSHSSSLLLGHGPVIIKPRTAGDRFVGLPAGSERLFTFLSTKVNDWSLFLEFSSVFFYNSEQCRRWPRTKTWASPVITSWNPASIASVRAKCTTRRPCTSSSKRRLPRR